MTSEESAHLRDLHLQLRSLYVQKAVAQSLHDQARLAELQGEINQLTEDCDKILDTADAE